MVRQTDTNGIVVITQVQPINVLFSIPEDRLSAVLRRVTLQIECDGWIGRWSLADSSSSTAARASASWRRLPTPCSALAAASSA